MRNNYSVKKQGRNAFYLQVTVILFYIRLSCQLTWPGSKKPDIKEEVKIKMEWRKELLAFRILKCIFKKPHQV